MTGVELDVLLKGMATDFRSRRKFLSGLGLTTQSLLLTALADKAHAFRPSLAFWKALPSSGPTGSWVASAAGETQWYKCLACDSSGNVYALSGDATIIKYSAAGVPQWKLSLTGSGGLLPWAIAYSAIDDTIVVAIGNIGDVNMNMLKITAAGAVSWQRAIGGGEAESYPGGLTVDSTGAIYLACTFYPTGGVGSSMMAAKFNSTCTAITWQRRWKNGTSYGFDIAVDSSSNVYISGVINNAGALYKLTSAGVFSSGLAGGIANEAFNSVHVDSSNNVYTPIFISGIAKYNSSLTLQWSATSGTRVNSERSYVTVDSSGTSYELKVVTGGGRVIARDTSGTELWVRAFNRVANVTPSVNEPVAGSAFSGSDHIVFSVQDGGKLVQVPKSGIFVNGTYNNVTFSNTTVGSATPSTISAATQATTATTGFSAPTTSTALSTSLSTSFTPSLGHIPLT